MGGKKTRKLFCVLMACILIISGSAFQAFAEEQDPSYGNLFRKESSELSDLSEDEAVYGNDPEQSVPESEPDKESDGNESDGNEFRDEAADVNDPDSAGAADESADIPGTDGDDGSLTDSSLSDSLLTDSSLSDISLSDSAIPDESGAEENLVGSGRNDIAEGLYVICSALNTKICLGIDGNSRDNNANAQLVTRNGGFGQAFYVKKVSDGVYTFINYNSGKALHIKGAGSAAGTNVVQYSPLQSKAQRWVIRDAEKAGYVTLTPTYTNLALDCAAGKSAAGTNVHINKAVNSERQMWKLMPAYGKVAAEARLTDAAVSKGYYSIGLAVDTGQVLDITAADKASGANAQIYESNDTYAQIFEILPQGSGLYKIMNLNSGKYLATANGSGYTSNVVQKTANNTDATQLWRILEDPTTGQLVLKPSNAYHAVLTADSDTFVSGTNVKDANFEAGSGQYWLLEETTVHLADQSYTPKEGSYYIYPASAPTKAIGVQGGEMGNGANVQLTSKQDSNAVKWWVIPNEDGTYTIQNVKSGKVLDINAGNLVSGENVQQYTANKTKAQKWIFHLTGDTNGSFYIASADHNLVLDITGARFLTGSNAWIYAKNNTSAQKYLLERCSVTASGWATAKSGNRYYYVNGNRVTGWKKIGSNYYYFRSTGIMAKNTTVDGYTINTEGVSNKTDYKTMTGARTLRALLTNAVMPAGKVLYIWGGGWGGMGTGSSNDSSKIGMLPGWTTFYNNHAKPGYNYHDYEYNYGMGLDCSGFTAWAVYNTIYDRDNVEEIVTGSSSVASYYISRGWCYDSGHTFKPGDIVSRSGHVWISMGTCKDGSVLIMNATPEGCMLCGTDGISVQLASKYMKMANPNWPFGIHQNGAGYLTYVGKATWKVDGTGILTDPDGMQKMTAEQVCKIVFGA